MRRMCMMCLYDPNWTRVIVSDARFFNFKSTSSDERRECADFWQSWFNQTFTSADYNSFFYREPDSAGGGKGVTPAVTAKQTRSTVYVDQSAATPVYVQTSPVDGKNTGQLAAEIKKIPDSAGRQGIERKLI